MCGFAGFVNIKEKLHENSKTILENMNKTLSKRGPDEDGYFVSDNVYLAHKRLIVIDPDGGKQPMIEKYSFDAVSLRCFDLIAPLKATGCIALALLNSEGIPASCEGDTRSLLSMIVMNTLTGRPCFMANPSRIDVSRKTVVFAHCTLPLSMVRDYSLTTHFESGISVAVKGEFEKGVYTVFKCFEDGRYAVQKAVFEENLCEATLCRTQIRLSCPDVDYFLTSPLGNHQIIVSGDHTECVNAFFSALKNWK